MKICFMLSCDRQALTWVKNENNTDINSLDLSCTQLQDLLSACLVPWGEFLDQGGLSRWDKNYHISTCNIPTER